VGWGREERTKGRGKAPPRNKCAKPRTVRAHPVMPASRLRRGQAPAGIHDFLCCDKAKSWIPAFTAMMA